MNTRSRRFFLLVKYTIPTQFITGAELLHQSRASFGQGRDNIRKVAHAVHVWASSVCVGETRADERLGLFRDDGLRRELHAIRVDDDLLSENFFLNTS